MKIATMRRVDRILGVPACFFLTTLRKLCHILRLPCSRVSQKPGKILFIKLAEQGATVLAYSALRRACELVGRENVYFLVFEENRPVLDVMNVVPLNNVIAIPAKGLIGTIFGSLRAMSVLRSKRIDTVVDLEFFARCSAILSVLCGARTRVGFHSFAGEAHYRGNLMTHRLGYNQQIHIETVYRMMIEATTLDPMGLPALDLEPGLQTWTIPQYEPSKEQVDECLKMIASESRNESCRPLVLLNASGSDLVPLRRWAGMNYVELAKALLEASDDLCVAFTGMQDEVSTVHHLVSAVGSERCFSLAGSTSFEELLTLYSCADVLVTNDSGPAHFAALTPIDVVALFGPESPHVFGTRSDRTHAVWKGLLCSPCVNAFNDRVSVCRNNICMQHITVEEISQKVRELLNL